MRCSLRDRFDGLHRACQPVDISRAYPHRKRLIHHGAGQPRYVSRDPSWYGDIRTGRLSFPLGDAPGFYSPTRRSCTVSVAMRSSETRLGDCIWDPLPCRVPVDTERRSRVVVARDRAAVRSARLLDGQRQLPGRDEHHNAIRRSADERDDLHGFTVHRTNLHSALSRCYAVECTAMTAHEPVQRKSPDLPHALGGPGSQGGREPVTANSQARRCSTHATVLPFPGRASNFGRPNVGGPSTAYVSTGGTLGATSRTRVGASTASAMDIRRNGCTVGIDRFRRSFVVSRTEDVGTTS